MRDLKRLLKLNIWAAIMSLPITLVIVVTIISFKFVFVKGIENDIWLLEFLGAFIPAAFFYILLECFRSWSRSVTRIIDKLIGS